jgi:glycosyltransferase involved in cell wall biosynthesis
MSDKRSWALVVRELDVHGGTHKQVCRLASHLVSAGERVLVITGSWLPGTGYSETSTLPILAWNPGRPAPMSIGRVVLSRLRWVLGFARFVIRCLPRDIDIVNFHDMESEFVIPFVRVLRPRARIIWQINDLPRCFRVGISSSAANTRHFASWRRIARWSARQCAAVTVNVSRNKRLVKQHLGVDAEVLYCGVDQRFATPPRREKGSRSFRVLSTGVFFPYRNYEILIRALILSRDRGLDVSGAIVGRTDWDAAYAARIAALIQEEKCPCEILGEVDEIRLNAELSAADAFVFLNKDQSWGLSVFEALNAGLPVILSRSTGAVELLGSTPGVHLVDPDDSEAVATLLASFANDMTNTRAAGAAGAQAVAEMTWERMYCSPLRALADRLVGAR